MRATLPRYRFDQLMRVGCGEDITNRIGGAYRDCGWWLCAEDCGPVSREGDCGESSGATAFFFYLLAAVMVGGGGVVITRKNAVRCGLALITALLAQAGIYLMLYAPFVAGVQFILYAGGIMVLFNFVIMLISIERNMKERQFNKQWLVGFGGGRCARRASLLALTLTKSG